MFKRLSVSPTSKQVTYDETYTVPTPTRTGYTFAGWYNGSTKYTGGTWKTASNTTLTAKWTPRTDISYVVNHYQQNANDDGYTLKDVQNLTGTADSTIKPGTKSYTHFNSPYVQSVTVKPDGSLVVNYYYDRVTYDLTYVTNGGVAIATQTYKYDQTLVIATPTRSGYTFGGWFTDAMLTTAYSATTTLSADTTIYAYWSEENKPGDFTYSGTTAIAISAYTGTSTTMWIPTYIGGIPVTTISASAFENNANLLKVVVPESVTSIGLGAFKGCNAIEDITLPFVGNTPTATYYDAVFGYIFGYTSDRSGGYHFSNSSDTYYNGKYGSVSGDSIWQYTCHNYYHYYNYSYYYDYQSYYYYIPTTIKSVTITVQTAIPTAAFNNCSFIETITIPNTVTSIGDYAFQNCTSLKRLNSATDGEFNIPTGVTEIKQYAFKDCDEMIKVTIPEGVTNIATYAFYSCAQLADIEFATGCKLETIGDYAFADCVSIPEIQLPTTVTSIGSYAFSGCISIAKINSNTEGEMLLPENVITIGSYAFQNLELMTKVVVPESVTSIGLGAFKGCNVIEDITLPFVGNTATATYYDAVFGYIFGYITDWEGGLYSNSSNTIYYGGLYSNSSNTTYYNVKYGSVSEDSIWQYTCQNYRYYSAQFGHRYYYQSYFYYIPTTIKNVTITVQTAIPTAAFNNCSFIETITIPNTVTSIGDYAFQNCSATVNQTYVPTLSYWNGTDISSSFLGSGTEVDPYQINSAADLAYLASSVNSGESYAGKYFVLNVDLNLKNKSWTPIGTKANPFAGTFDGNGKMIYNLSVTMDIANAGLFGYVSGTIKQLGIVSGTIAPASTSASTYVGGLVGYLTGTVENCYSGATVIVNITNIVYAGGLVGQVDTEAIVKNSYASGNVTVTTTSGFAYAGGFVGMNKGTIEGSLAFGNVKAYGQNDSYSRNGGFAAKNGGALTECYRSESQILTKYTTAGDAYCDDGTVETYSNMISYAQSNWNSEIWEYELKYPSHK